MAPGDNLVVAADEELLTVEEAARRAKCGRTRMFERVRAGEIESIKVGHLRRIPVSAFNRWVQRLLREQTGVPPAGAA